MTTHSKAAHIRKQRHAHQPLRLRYLPCADTLCRALPYGRLSRGARWQCSGMDTACCRCAHGKHVPDLQHCTPLALSPKPLQTFVQSAVCYRKVATDDTTVPLLC